MKAVTKMKKPGARERQRLRVLIDDGETLHLCWALRLHDDQLLLDTHTDLVTRGAVSVIALTADGDLDLTPIPGRILVGYEDVLVPVDADYRFLAAVQLALDDAQREALQRSVDSGFQRPPRGRRPVSMTHDPGVLDTSIWCIPTT